VDPLEALLHRTVAIYTALDMNFGDAADEANFALSAFSEVQLLLDIEVPKIRTLHDTRSPLSR
jgi:hypothetical protein